MTTIQVNGVQVGRIPTAGFYTCDLAGRSNKEYLSCRQFLLNDSDDRPHIGLNIFTSSKQAQFFFSVDHDMRNPEAVAISGTDDSSAVS